MRKGMGKGKGSGWKNLRHDDSMRHSLASRGIKSAQKLPYTIKESGFAGHIIKSKNPENAFEQYRKTIGWQGGAITIITPKGNYITANPKTKFGEWNIKTDTPTFVQYFNPKKELYLLIDSIEKDSLQRWDGRKVQVQVGGSVSRVVVNEFYDKNPRKAMEKARKWVAKKYFKEDTK